MRGALPETHYAREGEVHLAYQVFGEGPDLVFAPGAAGSCEWHWEDPNARRFIEGLASFSRVVMFDKRGTGRSDPMSGAPTLEERMDDIRAVMDAAGSSRAAIFGISEGGTLGLLFAHLYPERARALILYGSWARRRWAPDYPWGITDEELEELLDGMERSWATGEWWAPTPFDDEQRRMAWALFLRTAASPAMAQDIIRMNCDIDLRDLLPSLSLPTLILHRAGDQWINVGHARYLAERIPEATYVELPGDDHRFWLEDTDELLTQIEVFLTGKKHRPRRKHATGPGALSRREREVAVLAARAVTAPEIARQLFVSERTVETHLVSVYTKLGVASKAELIRRATEFGL